MLVMLLLDSSSFPLEPSAFSVTNSVKVISVGIWEVEAQTAELEESDDLTEETAASTLEASWTRMVVPREEVVGIPAKPATKEEVEGIVIGPLDKLFMFMSKTAFRTSAVHGVLLPSCLTKAAFSRN